MRASRWAGALALSSFCNLARAGADDGFARWTRDEGFHLESSDGNYRMRFALIAGFELEAAFQEGERTVNSALSFLQPKVSGHFYQPWLGYGLALELAEGDAYLREASLTLEPWRELGACVGKQGALVSRHEGFSQAQIFFPDYANVAGYFWTGREKGITLYGSAFDETLDYFAGLYGSAPSREPLNDPEHYVAEARVTASPLGRINDNELPFTSDGKSLPLRASFTLQGYHGRLSSSIESNDPTTGGIEPEPVKVTQTMTTAGGDLWIQAGPVIVFGEYYARYIEDEGPEPGYFSQGAWAQVAVDVYERLVGAGARISTLDPKLDLDDDRAIELEGQLAWFIHAPELVAKASYSYLHQSLPDAAALGDYPLPFPPGAAHALTLELTLSL